METQARPVTLEDIYALFDRYAAKWDERLAAEKAEREAWERERKAEDDKSAKGLRRQMGELGKRLGDVSEQLVAPNITEKFNALGYHFNDLSRDCIIYNEDHTKAAEFDVLLENGNFAIGVEIKVKPNQQDIKDQIERMSIFREYKDRHGDTWKIRGALAAPIITEGVKNYALDCGLYVIEQSGDTLDIQEPPAIKSW
jgi:hypothetical protein